MSARHLNRLAKAKGLDPLLGDSLDLETSDESDGAESSDDEASGFASGAVLTALAFGEDSDESSNSFEEEDDGSNSDYGNARSASASAATDGNSAGDAPMETSPQDTGNTDAAEPPPSTSKIPLESAASLARAPQPPVAEAAGKATTLANANRKKAGSDQQSAAGGGVVDDDDEYLDSLIAEMAAEAASTAAAAAPAGGKEPATGASSPLALLLRCDPRCLKLDQELRRKFGRGGDREIGGGGRARRTRRGMMMMPRGGGINSVSAPLTLKRLLVSAPKEDWPKPPSFVGGGLGMKRCESGAPAYLPRWQVEAHRGAEWFVFERSGSLEQLQRKFETVQSMHDPNFLASFASRAPYHADALLQLGMVFAHTGQMDRASEFVGRSLYVLESAAIEAFRPAEGACRMDVNLEANKTYFAALFRHMQMSAMVGGVRTALEVGRLLLSLDPLGDPMGCLLALDNNALASRRGEFLIELHRSRLPIGRSPSDAAKTFSLTPEAVKADVQMDVTVEDLPGLSMSVCLAMLDTTGDVMAAREAMASTLLRFPVMLEPILEKCGVSARSTTYPHNWKSVMQHPHFGGARDRLPAEHVLFHFARIFAQRGGEIWKHERAQELLYDGAGIALQGLASPPAVKMAVARGRVAETTTATPTADGAAAVAPAPAPAAAAESRLLSPPPPPFPFGAGFAAPVAREEGEVLRRAYGRESPIHKYLDMALSDFDESFALLPQEANALDPRLMGPNFMNERVRLRLPPGVARGGGEGDGGGGWRGGQDVLDEVLAMAMQVIGRQDAAARMRRQGGEGGGGGGRSGGAAGGNLSPKAPLAQLFWQTLLPWNTFPTPSRPVPPPPRWL